ncbi:ERF family protein, partial [Enterococcus mundtii]
MSEKTFTEKVVAIQTTLKAPKGQVNKFGNYKYRSLEDINEALKPLLAEEKLQLTISDELVMIGNRYYVKATATISDSQGHRLSVDAYAREAESKKGMDESQITGTASSYARKYAMNGLFL